MGRAIGSPFRPRRQKPALCAVAAVHRSDVTENGFSGIRVRIGERDEMHAARRCAGRATVGLGFEPRSLPTGHSLIQIQHEPRPARRCAGRATVGLGFEPIRDGRPRSARALRLAGFESPHETRAARSALRAYGGTGIRTQEAVRLPVFKTGAIGHSAIPPRPDSWGRSTKWCRCRPFPGPTATPTRRRQSNAATSAPASTGSRNADSKSSWSGATGRSSSTRAAPVSSTAYAAAP